MGAPFTPTIEAPQAILGVGISIENLQEAKSAIREGMDQIRQAVLAAQDEIAQYQQTYRTSALSAERTFAADRISVLKDELGQKRQLLTQYYTKLEQLSQVQAAQMSAAVQAAQNAPAPVAAAPSKNAFVESLGLDQVSLNEAKLKAEAAMNDIRLAQQQGLAQLAQDVLAAKQAQNRVDQEAADNRVA